MSIIYKWWNWWQKKIRKLQKYMIQMIRADKSIWCISDINIFVTIFCNINIDKYHIIIAEHLNADTAKDYISTLICMHKINTFLEIYTAYGTRRLRKA